MTDRALTLPGPLVPPALAGQLRLVLLPLKVQPKTDPDGTCRIHGHLGSTDYLMREIAPRYWAGWQPGDRAWLRETWNVYQCSRDGDDSWPLASIPETDPREDEDRRAAVVVEYKAGPVGSGIDSGSGPWRSSTQMPRWASRLTLHIDAVDVLPAQDVGKYGAAAAAGIVGDASAIWDCEKMTEEFARLFDSIHGTGTWDANPWCAWLWCSVRKGNIDG